MVLNIKAPTIRINHDASGRPTVIDPDAWQESGTRGRLKLLKDFGKRAAAAVRDLANQVDSIYRRVGALERQVNVLRFPCRYTVRLSEWYDEWYLFDEWEGKPANPSPTYETEEAALAAVELLKEVRGLAKG